MYFSVEIFHLFLSAFVRDKEPIIQSTAQLTAPSSEDQRVHPSALDEFECPEEMYLKELQFSTSATVRAPVIVGERLSCRDCNI